MTAATMERRPGAEQHVYIPRGTAKAVFACRDAEVLLSGPAGTGKSRAVLEKLNLMCLLNPGMRALMVRKTLASLGSTALVTWREHVVPEALAAGQVMFHGGSSQQSAQYRYKNGSSVTIGGMDKATKVMSSEYDFIYCLAGDTLVDSPSEIEKGYRRPYSGEIVSIKTAAGHKLTGTPNHPILTDQGWVALGELHVGSHVVSRSLGQNGRLRGDPDIENRPAPIADVVRALALAAAGDAERVETVPMDFHGDGGNGYVDVVSTASYLQGCRQVAFDQPIVKLDGERGQGEGSLLVGDRPLFDLTVGADAASVGRTYAAAQQVHAAAILVGLHPALPGFGGLFGEGPLPLTVGVSDVAQGLAFAWRAPRDAAGGHLGLESGSADAELPRGAGERVLPSDVALDRVVELSRREAPAGWHVYNLQTRDHWYYANNIVSHNCQEAIELTEEDWEALTTRLRNGKVSFQQICADANPDVPTHWLKARCDRGQTTMLNTRHEDNPLLFDDEGQVTDVGASYIAKLDALTGVRRDRLRFGKWCAAEGLIYEDFDPQVHKYTIVEPPDDWTRYWTIDFGFTNPFVLQCWAVDPDGRLYLYRELYRSRRLVEDHAKDILRMVTRKDGTWKEPKPRAVVCDHDAEDRATLERHLGLSTVAATKTVSDGIQAVQQRLKIQPDGRPRLFISPLALWNVDAKGIPRQGLVDEFLKDAGKPTCTLEEIPGYTWDTASATGRDKNNRETPRKQDDHGADALRYCVAELDFAPRPRVRWLG